MGHGHRNRNSSPEDVVNRRCASALSTHPITSIATGEILGALLESIGYGPDLVVLFVSNAHRPMLQEIIEATHAIMGPRRLIGTTARAVLGDGYESDGEPAISAWAGQVGAVRAVHTTYEDLPGHDPEAVLVLGSERGALLEWLEQRPDSFASVCGGVASSDPRQSVRVILDHEIFDDGAVFASFQDRILECCVTQGAVALGPPLAITRSERDVVYEIAFEPARDRLSLALAALSDNDRSRVRGAIHLATCPEDPDDCVEAPGRLREVLGADRTNGALRVDIPLETGEVIQLQALDRASALADLERTVAQVPTGSGDKQATGALLFSSARRGRALFGDDQCDASAVSELLRAPSAGVFCDEQYGPLESRSYAHKRSCAIAVVQGS